MTAEFSHGSIDDATNAELGSPSREELYEIIGDLHDRIVELQADPRLECTLTAEDLMIEMYEIDDELLLQKVESLTRRVMLWENKKIGDQAVQETIVPPRIRREVNPLPQLQEVIGADLSKSDEVLRIREEFLTEDVIETFAREWVEDFGDLVPTFDLITDFAREGKFYSYTEVRKAGGILALRQAIEVLYRPVVERYGDPKDELSSDYPDTTQIVLPEEYSQARLLEIIYDLHEKIAKIQENIKITTSSFGDIITDDLEYLDFYSDEELRGRAELLCQRFNELQKRIVGRAAIEKSEEIVMVTPGESHLYSRLFPHIPEEIIRIRERLLHHETPTTMEGAAESWVLKFGDEVPNEFLLEQLHQQRLYFSPKIIEDLGGVDLLTKLVDGLVMNTWNVRIFAKKSELSHEKPEVRMNLLVDAWDLAFPGERPTLALIDEKYAQKLPGWSWTSSMIKEMGGIKEFRRRLGYDLRPHPEQGEEEKNEEVVERLSTGDMIVVNWAL